MELAGPLGHSPLLYTSQSLHKVPTGFGKIWKVMEIDNAIFQDLESFEKERSIKMAVEMFWIFFFGMF